MCRMFDILEKLTEIILDWRLNYTGNRDLADGTYFILMKIFLYII